MLNSTNNRSAQDSNIAVLHEEIPKLLTSEFKIFLRHLTNISGELFVCNFVLFIVVSRLRFTSSCLLHFSPVHIPPDFVPFIEI